MEPIWSAAQESDRQDHTARMVDHERKARTALDADAEQAACARINLAGELCQERMDRWKAKLSML